MQGRFVSAEQLSKMVDPGSKGVFLKDESLKRRLKSPQAAAATLQILCGLMQLHGKQVAIDMIESYATGGDGGITEMCVREATGCRAPEKTEQAASESAPEFDPVAAKNKKLLVASMQLASVALENELDSVTLHQVSTVLGCSAMPGNPQKRRESFLRCVEEKSWRSGRPGFKQTPTFVPIVVPSTRLSSIIGSSKPDALESFPEEFDLKALKVYALRSSRLHNVKASTSQAHPQHRVYLRIDSKEQAQSYTPATTSLLQSLGVTR